MTFLLGYLLVGELCAVAFLTWAMCFNNRFTAYAVRPRWRDLRIGFLVQLLWPIAALLLVPRTIHLWRRAVQNEICVCGHRRADHLPADYPGAYQICDYKIRSSRWLVSGEGEEFIFCSCPKFTLPNVRPRR